MCHNISGCFKSYVDALDGLYNQLLYSIDFNVSKINCREFCKKGTKELMYRLLRTNLLVFVHLE